MTSFRPLWAQILVTMCTWCPLVRKVAGLVRAARRCHVLVQRSVTRGRLHDLEVMNEAVKVLARKRPPPGR
jgi:hypothetical protein